jgi:hypothetical protein
MLTIPGKIVRGIGASVLNAQTLPKSLEIVPDVVRVPN